VEMIDPALLSSERLRPLKRSEYDRLVALGCFEDEKIELLDGLLVAMSPTGAGHAYTVTKLVALLVRGLGERAIVRGQVPFGAAEDSEPEPDLAVVPNQDYSHDHPTHAMLVVEVAESSLRKDRGVKAALYARAQVAEYWIVNLTDRTIEVHRDPLDGRYASVVTHAAGDVIHPECFPDLRISIAEVLPKLG
jgi:Uma2 family endonuclease